jgi:hypothetical protein
LVGFASGILGRISVLVTQLFVASSRDCIVAIRRRVQVRGIARWKPENATPRWSPTSVPEEIIVSEFLRSPDSPELPASPVNPLLFPDEKARQHALASEPDGGLN